MTLVRDPVLRGVRDVAALAFTGPSAAADALAAWQPGASLHRLEGGDLLLRLAVPVAMRCETGPATPLVEEGGHLVGLPLPTAGLAGIPPRTVVRLRHGRLLTEEIGDPVDPATLLDLGGWRVVRAEQTEPVAVAAPREPPAEPRPAFDTPPFDARNRLGRQGEPDRRDQRAWDGLARHGVTRTPRTGAPAARAGSAPAARAGSAPADTMPSLFEWLHKRRRQRYLDELTRLFATGDIDAALRRAIPFRGEGHGPVARGGPRARDELRITPDRARPASVLPIEAGLRAALEQRYRAAFSQLDGAGRFLDAAFVLADLLDRTGEACSYLERHGEIRLAAELSEARSPDHAETVRLWWRAGERERAVAVARRHGCFGPAVVRLERARHHDEADALRRAWMAFLLDAGDLPGAYDAGAGLDDDAAQAVRRRLVDLGVEAGGPLRPRMLARHLRAGEDAPHAEVLRLVGDASPGGARDRETLAAELATSAASVDHPAVVRSLTRRLLADGTGLAATQVQAVVDLAADPVLRADLPPLVSRPTPLPSLDTVWVDADEHDTGLVAVRDARALAGGQLAVALAGAGVRIVRASGSVAAEFDVPADELIPSDNGLRLLAVRHLGDGAVGVRAIALAERKVRPLGELPAMAWASDYDGAAWFVASGHRLWMLDVLADQPSALWREAIPAGQILAVSRAPDRLAVALAARDGERFVRRYGLPTLAVLGSDRCPPVGDLALLPTGEVVDATVANAQYRARREDGGILTVVATRQGVEAPVAVVRLAGATHGSVRLDGAILVVADDRGRVESVDLDTGTHHAYRARA